MATYARGKSNVLCSINVQYRGSNEFNPIHHIPLSLEKTIAKSHNRKRPLSIGGLRFRTGYLRGVAAVAVDGTGETLGVEGEPDTVEGTGEGVGTGVAGTLFRN